MHFVYSVKRYMTLSTIRLSIRVGRLFFCQHLSNHIGPPSELWPTNITLILVTKLEINVIELCPGADPERVV